MPALIENVRTWVGARRQAGKEVRTAQEEVRPTEEKEEEEWNTRRRKEREKGLAAHLRRQRISFWFLRSRVV